MKIFILTLAALQVILADPVVDSPYFKFTASIDGHDYFFIESPLKVIEAKAVYYDYVEASKDCEKHNAVLGKFETEKEFDAVTKYLDENNYGDYLFGTSGFRKAGTSDWTWGIDGIPFTYSKFHDFTVSQISMACLRFKSSPKLHEWYDGYCSDYKFFFCEKY